MDDAANNYFRRRADALTDSRLTSLEGRIERIEQALASVQLQTAKLASMEKALDSVARETSAINKRLSYWAGGIVVLVFIVTIVLDAVFRFVAIR